MTEYRAEFDAVTFLNGGGLQAQGFKLDVPDPEITQDQLASLFVGQLGLLMTEQVTLRAVRVVPEPHKGLRGHPQAPGPAPPGPPVRLVELSHPIRYRPYGWRVTTPTAPTTSSTTRRSAARPEPPSC